MGVQGAGEALKQVLATAHRVLYKQLLAWLLQGHLYDLWCELFVVREEEGKGEDSAWGEGEESAWGEGEGELSRSNRRR